MSDYPSLVVHAVGFLRSRGFKVIGYQEAPLGFFDFKGTVENESGQMCDSEGSIDLSEVPDAGRMSYSSSVKINGKEYEESGYINVPLDIRALEDVLMSIVSPVYSNLS